MQQEELYHISPGHVGQYSDCQQLKVGDAFESGVAENPFYSFYLQYGKHLDFIKDGVKSSAFPISYMESKIRQNKGLTVQELTELCSIVKNFASFYYELIFESVRKSNYSTLPSRQKCLWLIPSNPDCLQYWVTTLGTGDQRKLYKVKCTGVFHYANPDLLAADFVSVKQMVSIANQYWEGVPKQRFANNTEVLFEGKFEVISELDISSLS